MMREDWRQLLGVVETSMPEYETWVIEAPQDVDAFLQETEARHGAAGRTSNTDHRPAPEAVSREELAARARARAEHGERLEIIAATARSGERILRFDCWTITPGQWPDGTLETVDESPPVQFRASPG